MATIYKPSRSKYYYLNIYYEGRRYRYSTKTDDIKIARRILKIREGELALKRFKIPVEYEERMLLSEFVEKYLKYSKNNKAPGTYKNIRSKLNNFLEFTDNKVLKYIDGSDIENFKNECLKNVAKSTCNTTLQTLKAMFNRAVELGYINGNPLKKVKMCKMVKMLPIYLNTDEINMLIDAIDDNEQFKNYIQFLLYTGTRRNEALMVKWSDIDARRRRISVLGEKIGKQRTVPINQKLSDILKSMDRDGEYLFSLSVNYVNKLFGKYLKKSGIKKKVTINSLRHTFASWLVMSGTSLYAVKELLGHTSIKTSEIYSHLSNGFIQDSIKKLPY